jgi:hypothetical protein
MSVIFMTCYFILCPPTAQHRTYNALGIYPSISTFPPPRPPHPHHLDGGLAPITTTLSPSPATHTVPVAFTLL